MIGQRATFVSTQAFLLNLVLYEMKRFSLDEDSYSFRFKQTEGYTAFPYYEHDRALRRFQIEQSLFKLNSQCAFYVNQNKVGVFALNLFEAKILTRIQEEIRYYLREWNVNVLEESFYTVFDNINRNYTFNSISTITVVDSNLRPDGLNSSEESNILSKNRNEITQILKYYYQFNQDSPVFYMDNLGSLLEDAVFLKNTNYRGSDVANRLYLPQEKMKVLNYKYLLEYDTSGLAERIETNKRIAEIENIPF